MPTALKRSTITHTEPVVRALEVAARVWPQEKDSVLLLRLVDRGREQLAAEAERLRAERRARVLATAGICDGVYGPDYLDEIREGWV